MNTITKSEFTKLSAEELQKVIPLVLTIDGAPVAMIVNPADIIYLGDLHPRVRVQFKAREVQVRAGMPRGEVKIHIDELRAPKPQVEPKPEVPEKPKITMLPDPYLVETDEDKL